MGSSVARIALALGLGAVFAATACAAPAAEEEESAASEGAATTADVRAADPAATPLTKTVLANLRSFDFGSADPFDHRVLVGQEEADVSNRTTNGLSVVASDLQSIAKKPPAIVSYELSHAYKHATTMFDPAAFRAGAPDLRKLVVDKRKKGILVSLAWHMRCPKAQINDADKFAPKDCPRDYTMEELLERKEDGSQGTHFAEWRAMLDELAELLFSLKDERGVLIPVQMRPFHEFTGEWFWWGRQNDPETYVAVWREMVDYLRRGRDLHNVLWVFNPAAPSSEGNYAPFYPGDDYVDVVSFDRYDLGDGRFERGYEDDLEEIGAFARAHDKVAAVAEVGTNLATRGVSADPTWFTRAMLAPLKKPGRGFAYVSIWRNAPWEKFVPEPGDGAIADDFARAMSDSAAVLGGQHNLYAPLHRSPPP